MGCAISERSFTNFQGFGGIVITFEALKGLDTGNGSTLEDYKFLYGFVSLIRPKRILDIGTNMGGSAIAMAMALRDEGLTKSKIVSIDIVETFLRKAQAQIDQLELSDYVELVRGDSSITKTLPSFDVVFIDGDHSFEGCLKDFENVKDKTNYVVIHDSASIDAVRKAIKTIRETGKYDVLNMDVGNWGEQWSLNRVAYRSYPGIAIVKVRGCLG